MFARDKREKKLVPSAVVWWGWVTFASFFAVSAIPFVTTGPLAFNGVISFWIAFFSWFFWIPSLSYFIIKGIDRVKDEEEAAGARRRLSHVEAPHPRPSRNPDAFPVWTASGLRSARTRSSSRSSSSVSCKIDSEILPCSRLPGTRSIRISAASTR